MRNIPSWIPILLLLFAVPSPAASQLLGTKLVGTNVTAPLYWSPEHKFIDQMKTSEPWRVQTTGVWNTGETPDLDADGWVQSIPEDREVACLILRGAGGHWPRHDSGVPITDWVVTYDGVGTFDISLSGCQLANPSAGRFEISNCTPSSGGINLAITSAQPGNYPKNIRIVPAAYENEDTDTDKVFFPYFLSELQAYTGPLRFGGFMEINSNDQVTDWASRPRISDAKQSSEKGAALEYAVKLSNDAMREMWLNVPYLATDDWVTQAAQYISANLDSSLKVVVEYSNEVWNSSFPVKSYTQQKAIDDGICTPADDPLSCGLFWYAKRSNEVHDIFEAILGDARVIRLHAGQAASAWVGSQILSYDNTFEKTEVYAIAPYFCYELGTPDSPNATEPAYDELNEVLAYCRDVYIPTNTFVKVEENKAMVDSYGQGIELWGYEGGQHLVGVGSLQTNPAVTSLFTAANRDWRMRGIYTSYFRGIFERGMEVFANYTTVSAYNEWGSWGVREFDDQDRSDSPKYDSLMCMLEDADTDGDSYPDCVVHGFEAPAGSPRTLIALAALQLTAGSLALTVWQKRPTTAPGKPAHIEVS